MSRVRLPGVRMSRTARLRWGAVSVALSAALLGWLLMATEVWTAVLTRLFPGQPDVLYTTASLTELTVRHLQIVAASSTLTVSVGLPLGIWATRPSGREFRDLIAAAVDFGQTFPPVAVLALAMPVFGLGLYPAIAALFLYGLFPVVSSTIAGLEGVPPAVLDAARGMGMGRWRILGQVELPLAARVIMAGIRTSVIINVGTATVASFVGAGGLGDPIIGGLNVLNNAWVLQGALVAAALAVLLDSALGLVESALAPL